MSLGTLERLLAWIFLIGALAIDIAAWTGLVAKDEPQFVLHLSTWALIYAAFTAVMVTQKESK